MSKDYFGIMELLLSVPGVREHLASKEVKEWKENMNDSNK